MAFLLNALGVLIVVWALVYLLTRRRRPDEVRESGDSKGNAPEAVSPPTGAWTRSDRIALASLVVGAVIGVLGLLAR